MKPVTQSIGSINVGKRVGENPLVEDKSKSLTYKMQENTNEVCWNLTPTADNKRSNVSFCEQLESNDVSYTIDDNTQRKKSSKVYARKQLQT